MQRGVFISTDFSDLPLSLAHAKKPFAENGFFAAKTWRSGLLDLGLFVFNVLARLRIKFHDRHFFRRSALVFRGRIEVTRACGRFQLDFVAA
jgi:hypothetical protein